MNQTVKGAGGGGGCFRKGTLVQMEGGQTAPIETLCVDDKILCFDHAGELHVATVEVVHVHEEAQSLIHVKFWNGEIYCTPNHWVLNQYGAFVEMGTLTTEDALVDGMGHLRPILSMEFFAHEPVWNLTVTPHHTFIANGIRVHNGGHRERFPTVRGSGGGGGKGGGGGARAAVEDPDSLRSKQYARVLDAICEGEIEGLVDGAKSVYLDDTPLQNSDGSYNFSDVTLGSRTGTQSQAYLPGFSDVEGETAVSTEVKHSASVTRSITNTNLDRVRVTIGVPQLTSQNTTTGDLHGSTVVLTVDLQTYVSGVGGGFSTQTTLTITGKATTKYQRAYSLTLPKPTGVTSWDIRVTRTTADSVTAATVDKTWWDSYTGITDLKLGYPNTALVGVSIDASQFRSIPRRAYDVKLLKVKIPDNYNPTTRAYTGSWGGSFVTAWTDNPVWCFYDLLTNDRYGLGQFIDAANLDKWQLYTIAQYCDVLVDNGFGGTEPRFTCNLYLQSQEEAYKVVSDMASIFRAMVFWANNAILVSQDSPSDPVALFTQANVIDGIFHYEGSSRQNRHTVAQVAWNDPADRCSKKIEYVEDADGIARYGIVMSDVIAFGCTSRGQAHRLGKWILYSDINETEIVSYDIGLFDIRTLKPGAVVKIMDSGRAGLRWAGRITSVAGGGTSINLDAATDSSPNSITLTAGNTYYISVVRTDGSIDRQLVTNVPATGSDYNVTNITGASGIGVGTQKGSIWLLEETAGASLLSAQLFRILSITETDKHTARISAISHNASKYAAIESGLTLQTLPISTIPLTIAPVTSGSIVTTESLYIVTGRVAVRLHIGWDAVPHAARYEVQYRLNNGVWQTMNDTSDQSIELLDLTEGAYDIKITAISWTSAKSLPVSHSLTLYGKTLPPSNVGNFLVHRVGNHIYLSWSDIPDLDRYGFELRSGATWETSSFVMETKELSTDFDCLISSTLLIKAVDTTGNYSTNASMVSVPSLSSVNVVLSTDDSIKTSLQFGRLMGGYTETGVLIAPINNFTLPKRSVEMWVKPNFSAVATTLPALPAPFFSVMDNAGSLSSNMQYNEHWMTYYRAASGPASLTWAIPATQIASQDYSFSFTADINVGPSYKTGFGIPALGLTNLSGGITVTIRDGEGTVVQTVAYATPTSTTYTISGTFSSTAVDGLTITVSFTSNTGTALEGISLRTFGISVGTAVPPSSSSYAMDYHGLWQNGESDAFSFANLVGLGIGGGNLTFVVHSPTSGIYDQANIILDNTMLAYDKWSLIVATYEAAGITLSIQQEGGTRHTATGAGAITPPNAFPYSWQQIGNGLYGNNASCFIDEVRIYNRVLSTTEIDDHFTGVHSNNADLVAYWPITEGIGTSTVDVSGNNNTATLNMANSYPAIWIQEGAPATTWGGVKTNLTADGDYLKTTASTGSYESLEIDQGNVFTSAIDLNCKIVQVGSGDITIAATYFIAQKNSSAETYSPWVEFIPGSYKCRLFKIKVELTNSNTGANYAQLQSFQIATDVPDRVVHFEDVVIDAAHATSGVTLLISPSFVGTRTCLVTMQAAATGDTYKVGLGEKSVNIKLFTSAGVAKAGIVDLDIFGYGENEV